MGDIREQAVVTVNTFPGGFLTLLCTSAAEQAPAHCSPSHSAYLKAKVVALDHGFPVVLLQRGGLTLIDFSIKF